MNGRKTAEGTVRGTAPKWVPLTIFAIVLALFPLQLAVKLVWDEPYPAIFQPSFAGTPLVNGVLHRQVPDIELIYASGATRTVEASDVLPRTRLHVPTVFRAAFWDETEANSSALREWLESALAVRYGEPVDRMTVTWKDQTYDPWSRAVVNESVVKTVDVEF